MRYSLAFKKEMLPQHDKPGGHFAKWNKPDADKKYCMTSLIYEIFKKKMRTGGVVQLAEHLLCKCKAPNLNPSPTKKLN
jgi:hypothetical protein